MVPELDAALCYRERQPLVMLPGRRFYNDMDYKAKRWERLREAVLRRDNYTCQESLRYGKHVEANTVHHIFPASRYPEYAWSPWNLISVSAAVHNSYHVRSTDELTEKGRELQIRTARARGIPL